jgi:hypothetical protein
MSLKSTGGLKRFEQKELYNSIETLEAAVYKMCSILLHILTKASGSGAFINDNAN